MHILLLDAMVCMRIQIYTFTPPLSVDTFVAVRILYVY